MLGESMAQKKAHEVDTWLARRDPQIPILLFYGPDRGLVSERARKIVASTGLSADDPFSVVRLDAAEIEQTPGRLVDEARTIPMFSDRRLIWVRNAAAQKALAEDVKALAEQPPRDAIILIEAGDLKKGVALRAAVEASEHAMALPCYADEGRNVDSLIDEELQKAGLSIALDARQLLKRSLGGDRLASRGELEKLALYAAGRKQITLDDVQLMTGDVSGLSLDHVIDAVLEGKSADFDAAFNRLSGGGNQAPAQVLSATLRQFQSLQLMRGTMERDGRGAASVVASARPPVFFTRRRTVENALSAWSAEGIARALGSLQAAVLHTRRRPDLALPISRQALLAITLESTRLLAG
jgi:DNA polymerase III subunit delta